MHADPTAPEPPQGEFWSDEPPMENYRHLMQMIGLITTLRWLWRDRTDYFAAGNMTIYYSQVRRRSEDFRGPDFFVALDVDGTRERRSWVVWQEGGKYPNVIVELLSETTEANDRGEKMRIYEQVFRTPEYFLFDPESCTFEGFRIEGGNYVPINGDGEGRLASQQLGLLLGVRDRELRFFTTEGELVLKPDEALVARERELELERRELQEQRRMIEGYESEIAELKRQLASRDEEQ